MASDQQGRDKDRRKDLQGNYTHISTWLLSTLEQAPCTYDESCSEWEQDGLFQ